MEVSGKIIRFPNTLWVQLGGVKVKNEAEGVVVEGVDEDSYLKIFNHFGRVLKLYTFENGQWVDSATGMAPVSLDESLVGHVPAARHTSSVKPPPGRKSPAKKKPAAKSGPAKSAAKGAAKSSPAKSAAKGAARSGPAKSAAKGAAKPAGKKASRRKS